MDNTEYDPKTIAIKLLEDDNIKLFKGQILLCDSNNPTVFNNEFIFETLTLILMYMIYYIKNNNLIITINDFDEMENKIINAFLKIKYHVFINKYEDTNYYCRVILKQEDKLFFIMHPSIINNFHVILNGSYEIVKSLNQMKVKLILCNEVYTIHFDNVNIR